MTNCGVRRSKPSATDIKEAKSDSSIRMIPAAVGVVKCWAVICIPWAKKVTTMARMANGTRAWSQWTWAKLGRSNKRAQTQPRLPCTSPIKKITIQGEETVEANLAK